MTKLEATPLSGSMLGYYRAQCGNLAAYGLTANEAARMLCEMMKKRRV